MILSDAVTYFKTLFETVTTRGKAKEEDVELPLVVAGGIIKVKDNLPALYLSEAQAADEWLRQAIFHAGRARDKLEWVLTPELCEFQITMADRRNQHRLVSKRFSVKSQFVAHECPETLPSDPH